MKNKKILLSVAALLMMVLCLLIVLNQRSAIRYNSAQNMLSGGNYEGAGNAFAALGGYEESSRLSMYARACAAAEDGDYYAASQAFSSLGDYKDCQLLSVYYSAWQNEMYGESYLPSYIDAISTFQKIPLFRDSKKHISDCREKAYSGALAQGDQGDYALAASVLNDLGSYQDSKKQAAYYTACNNLTKGRYTQALEDFKNLGDFRDSPDWLEKTRQETYTAAEKLLAEENYTSAYVLFTALGDYSDAAERIQKSKYQRAEALLTDRKYEQAYALFIELGEYADSAERILKSKYERAEEFLAQGEYDLAYTLFAEAGDYADAKDRILKSKYDRAKALLAEGQYTTAYALFEEIAGYEDAEEQILKSKYDRAKALLTEGQYTSAYTLFEEIPNYKDSAEQILKSKYERAENCLNSYDFEKAEALFAELGNYADAAERLKSISTARKQKLAEDYMTMGRYTDAREIWLELENNEKATECSYLYANSLEATDPWSAWNAFTDLGSYRDSAKRASVLYPKRFRETGAEDGNGLRTFRDPESGLYGLLNGEADIVIEAQYTSVEKGLDNHYIVKTAKGSGVMQPDGTMVLDTVYQSISPWAGSSVYMVQNEKGYGVVQLNGETLIECGFTDIELTEDQMYKVKGNLYTGIYKSDGSVFIPVEYTEIVKTENGYSVKKDGKSGLLAEDGTVIIAAAYDSVEQLTDGRYRVQNGSKTGLAGSDGKIIVSALYDSIADMKDGRYLVTADGLQGILNPDGSAVITPSYQTIKLEDAGNYIVTLNDRYGIVSYEGQVLHEADMEEIRTGSNNGKYLIFKQNGLYGFMKSDTFEVNVPAEWKGVHIMYDGYAYIMNNLDQWGVIDSNGSVTVKPEWRNSDLSCYEDCGCAVYDKILLNNQGKQLFDFSKYNRYSYSDVKYLGNGVFSDGNSDIALVDTKAGKLYAFDLDGEDITKLKLYEHDLLTGYIKYKKSRYDYEYAYGVINANDKSILSSVRWDSISAVPGTAKKDSKYGWIGKDGRDLLKPEYDYIRSRTENDRIIAANYNDRGNLVYMIIDDTSGKVLISGIESEEAAVDQCWPEGRPEAEKGDVALRDEILRLLAEKYGYDTTDPDLTWILLECFYGSIEAEPVDPDGLTRAIDSADPLAMLEAIGHYDEILAWLRR